MVNPKPHIMERLLMNLTAEQLEKLCEKHKVAKGGAKAQKIARLLGAGLKNLNSKHMKPDMLRAIAIAKGESIPALSGWSNTRISKLSKKKLVPILNKYARDLVRPIPSWESDEWKSLPVEFVSHHKHNLSEEDVLPDGDHGVTILHAIARHGRTDMVAKIRIRKYGCNPNQQDEVMNVRLYSIANVNITCCTCAYYRIKQCMHTYFHLC